MKNLMVFTLSLVSLSAFANFEYINGECWTCSNGGKFIRSNFGCIPERKSTPKTVSLSACGVSAQQAQQDLWAKKTVSIPTNSAANRVQNSLDSYDATSLYATPQYKQQTASNINTYQAPTAYAAPQYQEPTSYVAPQYQGTPTYQATNTYAQPQAVNIDRAVKKKQLHELERNLRLGLSKNAQVDMAQARNLRQQLSL